MLMQGEVGWEVVQEQLWGYSLGTRLGFIFLYLKVFMAAVCKLRIH